MLQYIVVLLFLSFTDAQITNSGSISWVHFDNITITAPTTSYIEYHMWSMPRKDNWTGLIGFSTDTSNPDYQGQVSFTIGVDSLPPSFGAQTNEIFRWNSIIAASSIQLPASGGNGSDTWNFLFASSISPFWTGSINISVYIIEMQTINENQTSPYISLYNSQIFLYRVMAVGREFREGDTVKITTSQSCDMSLSLNVSHITNDLSDPDFYPYVYLNGNGTDLFVLIQVQQDCSMLNINVTRIPQIQQMSLGEQITLVNWTWYSTMLIRVAGPNVGIQLTVGGLQGYDSLNINAAPDNFQSTDSFTFQDAPFWNKTVWEIYSQDLEPADWFITVQGMELSYPVTITFTEPQSQIQFNVPYEVERDMSTGVCSAQTSSSIPTVNYKIPQESSCACLVTSWRNMQYSNSYPHSPLSSRLTSSNPPVFINPYNSDIFTNYMCLVRPLSSSSNILLTLQYPFDNSFDSAQNNTFFDVPEVPWTLDGAQITISSNTSMFFIHATAESKETGGVVVVQASSSCAAVDVAPDDWSWPWCSLSSPYTIFSANSLDLSPSLSSLDVGWYAVGETTTSCSISFTSVNASTISLSAVIHVSQATTQLQYVHYIEGDEDVQVAFIHISTDSPTVGVYLTFSEQVDSILAQAGTIPKLGPDQCPFTSPYDGVSRQSFQQSSISSFVIPAVAIQTGVITTEFYALVYTNSSNSPTISATASTISQSTNTWGNETWSVPSSNLPQIIHIPFSTELQVLSVEIALDDLSCVSGNNTQCVLFGAGGLQAIAYDRSSSPFIGMQVSPVENYYYSGNASSDYYMLVYPNTSQFKYTIRAKNTEYLCDPVLLCNGRGVCSSDRSVGVCECLHGVGYSFSGFHCDTKDLHLMGTYFIILVVAFYLSIKVVGYLLLRKQQQQQHHSSETMPLIASGLDSHAIREHLISTNLTLENVELEVGNAKLLKNVNLLMKSGDVTAIIGPSGAGKSTIVKVLSGRVKPTKGSIRINGAEISNLSDYRSLIAYVPQDDVMNPLLTVRENIVHSALMRLPRDMAYSEKIRLVDTVIDSLGLTAKKNTIVGDLGGQSSLSGGQRKRVSIGMELVICPSILLLDEPTSGLDSKTALSLVHLLKNQVAPMGINVIAVVHQPRYEILNSCDNILILAAGELRYFGKPTVAELGASFPRIQDSSRLNGANIADLLIDYIEEIKWPGFKHETHSESINATPNKPLKPRELPSFFKQLYLLTKRALQQIFRDTRSLIILMVLTILAACLIGALYHNSEFVGPPSEDTIAKCPQGFQFLCAQNQQDTYMVQGLLIALSLGLTAGSSSLSLFGGTEKLVHARECSTGQSNLAYYIAKMISIIPNQVLAPLLFIAIIHQLTQPSASFIHLFIVSLGIYEACIQLAVLSSIVLADSRALTISVVSLCICNVLSGFNPTIIQLRQSLGGVLGRALPAVSYSRWAIEAFYLSSIIDYNKVYNLSIALDTWDYSLDELSLAFAIPFAIGFVLRVICAVVIIRKGH